MDGSRINNRGCAREDPRRQRLDNGRTRVFYEIPHTQQSKCKACGREHDQIVNCPACNASQPPTKNDRKYHVRSRVKREVIFQGDKTTYDTIRHTSDGIEHGSGKFAEIWSVDFGTYEKTAKYLRQATFDLIVLEAS